MRGATSSQAHMSSWRGTYLRTATASLLVTLFSVGNLVLGRYLYRF